ncbi:hypothetical protein JQ595_23090 [Bradyrhizobium japonicum]|uniref:hypothetical protein n=2 Tax=Bradyrhizobium TaxID=374 RepID=UPI001BA4F666|nr:hypothetical protein [Bradyrhizobium japonicum]MBR0731633.1 hypothetical protein [Bradyrhizobium japonicum]
MDEVAIRKSGKSRMAHDTISSLRAHGAMLRRETRRSIAFSEAGASSTEGGETAHAARDLRGPAMLEGLIYLVINIVVVGLVIWLLRFLIELNPLGGPLRRVANVAVVVMGVLIIVMLLMNFVGKHLMA